MTYYIIDKYLNKYNKIVSATTTTTNNSSNNNCKIDFIEKNYENCCKESSWIQELYSLIELDERYKNYNDKTSSYQINEKFNNLKIECGGGEEISEIISNVETISTSTTGILAVDPIEDNNDKVIISSILSKLSYFNDKESIVNYLKSISKKSHVVEKIKKMYYFKPIHTRTKLLIAFDDQSNMYCSFQGTVNSGDLILDICCGFLEKIKFNDITGPKHSLFSLCSRVEWTQLIVGDLLSLASKLNKKSLIFCGHSIGGTFALIPCLEAIKVQKQLSQISVIQTQTNCTVPISNIKLKCFTFGSPSFLHPTSKLFLDENPIYNEIFENYFNQWDMVPMISHYPYIFIDFMYLIMCCAVILITIGYHLTTNGLNLLGKGIDVIIYNLVYPIIMLSIPLLIIKLMFVIYQYYFSLGLQSKFTRVYTHDLKKFIFFENQDKDVEFSFVSIKNHIKKLINYKKLLLIHDHKMDSYLTHLFNNYQIGGIGGRGDGNGNGNGSNINNILTINDITFLNHFHQETIEPNDTKLIKNKILKKGLLILGFCHVLWLFLSIPIFYKSLFYLCLINK